MILHPEKSIIDKNIGERLSTAYFRAATVGNAFKWFKKCGVLTYNSLVFSKHEFAASKATDHDAFGDETVIILSANPQALVVENQHINLPEESELMGNADYDALKKRVSVVFSNHCLKQHNVIKKENAKKSIKYRPKSPVASTSKDGVIKWPACEEEYCDPPTEE
ncbi:uncharacterized protein TNCV_3816101 [Trichonephila clavipes]|nr:uncharacterized protein TNCV_3816101 [Trichonephila clavipes]